MNKAISYIGALALSLALAPAAWAVVINEDPYDGTDVGAVDEFLAEGAKLGSETEETIWVNSVLGAGTTATFQVKDEPEGGIPYYSTSTDGVYAFLMSLPTSEYYLIKNSTRVALFRNVAEFNWGVFDTGSLSDAMNLPSDGYTISHVTRFNARTEVPEPTTLALLGLGLVGVGLSWRRRS